MRDDPHQTAFRILQQPEARQMVHILDPTVNVENEYGAFVSKHCVVCHATPADKSQQITYGVGCESCHGGAEEWIDEHSHETWNQLTTQQLRQHGYRDLTDPIVAAETCVGCHVGQAATNVTPTREVTHDLIAAGHPALRFDFVSYFAALPKHWKDTSQSSPWNQWKIAKLVSTKACLDLLDYRLRRTNSETTAKYTLEFSEFDCFGCHRSFVDDAKTSSSSGKLHWGDWIGGMNQLAGINTDDWQRLSEALVSPAADYQRISNSIKSLKAQIDQQLSEFDNSGDMPIPVDFIDTCGTISWEIETQWALAANAWIKSQSEYHSGSKLDQTLKDIFNELKFLSDYQSPLDIDLRAVIQRRSALTHLMNQIDRTNDSGTSRANNQ